MAASVPSDPKTAPSAESAGFRPDVQGLRGVAVVLVVLFHSGLPVPGGFAGVDVFFVISGFVITRLLARELDNTGSLSFRAFYARRVRRLLPALAIVAVVTLGVSFLVLSPLGSQQIAASTAATSALFFGNFALFLQPTGYFAAPAQLNPFLHTWSLAVEEQFYVIFPLLLLLGWRLARRRNPSHGAPRGVPIAVIVVLCLLSLALAIEFSYAQGAPFQSRNSAFAFYSSPTRAWEFGLGALVALSSARLARLPRSLAVITGTAGTVGLIASAFLLEEAMPYPGFAALLPTLGTTALIAAGTVSGRQPVSRLLGARPLCWVGDQSYGWYLWHWPAVVFASILAPRGAAGWVIAAGLLSLIPAWASKRFIEDPIRFAPLRFSALRTAVVAIVAPLTVSAALFAVATIATPTVVEIRAQRANHLDVVAGCTRNLPDDSRTSSQCTWPAGAPLDRHTIVLIGDSNAGQFAEPVVEIAEDLGMTAVLATKSGCPFADVSMHPDPPGCHAFVEAWVAALVHARPALVIISSAGTNYVTYEHGIALGDPASSVLSTSEKAKADVWETGTRGVVEPLSRAGIPVLFVHTLPHFKDWNIYRCPAVTLYSDPLTCGRASARADLDVERAPAFEAEQAALAGLQGVMTIDLADQICIADVCSTNDGARWISLDDSHITVGEARRLKSRFAEEIKRALKER
jgi:peptidoglycan/LPS O-acetylase OafA/YrhL